MNYDRFPVNVFDVILVTVIILGILRGRKNGMSVELFNLIKWTCILVVCTLAYEPVGRNVAQSSPFSLLSSYLLAYLGLALIIYGFFALLKHKVGDKLLGSDVFGQGEYYLGMVSGLFRFTCILVCALAMLNARYYSQNEIKAIARYQNDVYGSDFFPGLYSAQETVFQKSFSGSWIRRNLEFLLIKPTAPEEKRLRQKEFALPS